jgi:uncharacterized membrane protein
LSSFPGATTEQTLALLAAIVAFGLWAQKTRVGGTLSGPVCVMLLAAVLANVGLLPHASPAYDGIATHLVPAAVALFLLKANLVRIARESGRTLLAFGVGAATSLVGIGVAVAALALASDEAAIAGITAANLIGGTINVVAVAKVVGYEDPTRFAAVVSAGAAVAVLYLAAVGLLASSSWMARWFVPGSNGGSSPPPAAGLVNAPASPNALMLIAPIAIATAIVAAAKSIAAALAAPQLSLLVVTVIGLAVANLFPRAMAALRWETALGTIAMYVFFATLGAAVQVQEILGPAALIACFMLVATTLHLLLLLPIAALLRLNLQETLIGSMAAVAGPTTAAAFAAGRDWHALVPAAVLTGVLGFGIGTLAGLAVFALVQG